MTSDQERRARFTAVAQEVYEPIQRYLLRRARPADAADVFNDTLTVIWRRIDDVPWPAPLPYCYGVARRCLANQRRGSERQQRLVRRITAQRGGHAPDPAVAVDASDPELVAALGVLSEAEREIVHLWAWETLEPREIAAVLEITPNAVSVALTRARRKLADHLARQTAAAGGHNVGGHTGQHEESER